MLDEETLLLAAKTLMALRQRNDHVITAESCTGGLIAAALTHMAGSSDVVEGGFVTYSNAQKHQSLGVRNETLARYGAVSEQTAAEMAEGALKYAANATRAIAVTGIAGPGGGTSQKPVGLVCFGLAAANEASRTEQHLFSGTRSEIRARTVRHALLMLMC